MREMNPEPITQSEVGQKEKNNFHILTYIHGIRKTLLRNPFARQQWRHKENRFLDMGREGGEGGM